LTVIVCPVSSSAADKIAGVTAIIALAKNRKILGVFILS
jgi:hypothetical protein